MATVFGQLVIGPPGSGKTTFCKVMSQFLEKSGRKVAIVNIDPANDDLVYKAAVDVSQLITVEDVMTNLKLGPNGGLIYCMEYLEANIDWLLNQLALHKGHYFIFDCPGQVELYTHHDSVKNIMARLESEGIRLCAVQLVDSHYCSEPAKFISTLLMSLSAMLQIALPHVNVLSKADLMSKYKDTLGFGLDFYTDVLNLDYLLESLNEDPFARRYGKLNAALVSLIEGYGLVSFLPLDVKDSRSLLRVRNAVDKANGYIYGFGEERNIQSLLSCAVGAECETDRVGDMMDKFTNPDSEDNVDMLEQRTLI